MPWLIARYLPVGLFSLKHGEATSTGGKSLLIPTPFAIRTALLDAAIRVEGRKNGEKAFAHLKAVQIALRPPRYAAISGLFGKILKPERKKEVDRAMTPTIAFREYVHLWDELTLAFGGDTTDLDALARWLPHLTYLGKRGSFIQLVEPPRQENELPPQFISLKYGGPSNAFPMGVIQRVDEWGPELTFEKVNTFSEEKISLNKDRVRMDVIIPYRMSRAGRSFTLYERLFP
ncbi:MAG: hypothetical protein Fur0022_39540 [Anaerolineales bacterium]